MNGLAPGFRLQEIGLLEVGGNLVQRRVDPNTMGSTLAIQNATMCRRWRSNSARFMLPRFRRPHALRVEKGLFPQVRAGTAAPVLARPQDSLWPLRWFRLGKSPQESPPQSRYSPLLWRVHKRLSISCP